MRDYILRQLKNCKVAKIPKIDEHTNKIVIDKIGSKNGMSLLPTHYYLIELEDSVLSPSSSYVLHQNWNNSIYPMDKYYKCECVKVMAGMVKIEGSGCNDSSGNPSGRTWGGWLPIDGINIIKEIV